MALGFVPIDSPSEVCFSFYWPLFLHCITLIRASRPAQRNLAPFVHQELMARERPLFQAVWESLQGDYPVLQPFEREVGNAGGSSGHSKRRFPRRRTSC